MAKTTLSEEEKERLRKEYREEREPAIREPAPPLDPTMDKRRSYDCPVTGEEFFAAAQPITVTVNGQRRLVPLKEFSSGAFGWYLPDKMRIIVGEGKHAVEVKVQANLTFTVINSKPRPKEA